MFKRLLIFTSLILISCSSEESIEVTNDKLFNGYSYPVEGGITSTYSSDDINIIFFYNIKSSNLFSICSGELVKIEDNEIEIDCTTGEKIVYFKVESVDIKEDEKVQAGEKIGNLEAIGSLETSRYKVNIEFYLDKTDLSKSLTDQEFIDYLNIERENYEKE